MQSRERYLCRHDGDYKVSDYQNLTKKVRYSKNSTQLEDLNIGK